MSRAASPTDAPAARIRVGFAMGSPELRDALLPPDLLNRLSAIAEVEPAVLTEFDSPAARATLADLDALITGWGSPRIDCTVLDAAGRLRLIAHAAGTVKDHIAPECWDRGITVTTAADANAVPVAEYTLAWILLAGKQTLRQARYAAAGHQVDALDQSLGNHRTTVGIIGASRVGRLLLELLRPFELRVLLADPTVTSAEAAELGAELVALDDLFATSRVVSLHAPVLPATIGMIGAAQLALMPDAATFINTARGILVDHDALRRELATGRIDAVLDVTDPEPLSADDPLRAMPNVLITPHSAGSMGTELSRMGALAVWEVERFIGGRAPEHPVSRRDLDRMA